MKRFYKAVTIAAQPGGFAVHLDGRPVKTPGGKMLLAPARGLADLLMAEWAAQVDAVDPQSMPLTQILATAIDRVTPERAAMTAQVMRYLDTDLLCYRAADPPALAAAQAARWDDVLTWFARRFGAALATTTDLAALRQPAAAHAAAADYVAGLDDYRFTVLQAVVATAGSLVLALALLEGVRDADALFAAMHVEEDYKAALYNEDLHGRAPHQEQREAAVRRDLRAAQDFLGGLE